ncbi:MAG: hypothetical protein K6G83_15705, partial [Lachnospiraceae bacterium]|nr:hypothetical protein [Lachnospiraceae bacterium]
GNCPLRIFQAESPHTDDSTLIEVIDEKVLILGDSISGVYPEWTVDPLLAGRLEETIRKADPEICLHGHLEPMSPDEMIRIMYGG